MALTDDNGMVMPVQPMYGGNYGGGYGYPVAVPMGGYGYGNGFGGDWSSLIVLFLIAAMFGGFGGGWGGFGMGGFGGEMFTFPWLLAGQNGINQNVNSGFDNAAVGSQLNAIQNSITTGFSNSEVANCNRAIDNLQTSYNNQIAALNRSFDAQTAVDNRLDSISSDLQKCCCDNELRTEQLRFTVATENAADREALSNGIRDIITNQTAGTQAILDKLCDQELQAERRQNQELRTQLQMRDLAASQAAQTAALVADNTAQTNQLIDRIAPYPQPSFIVGNPYYSGYNYGYGNCNNGFNNFGFNPFGNVGFGNGSF